MYREGQKKVAPPSMMTGRAKAAMKSLEEVYGVKYETPVPNKTNQKSVVKASATTTITYKDRGDMDMDFNDPTQTYRPNYNKYLITAGDHYHEGQTMNTTRRSKAVSFNGDRQATLEQSHAEVISKQEQYFKNDQGTTARSSSNKMKTARARHAGGEDILAFQNVSNQSSGLKREDTFVNGDGKKSRGERTEHRHHHHHHVKHGTDHNNSLEAIGEDKDDDTEEFIGLIKRAVEKSVTKSMNEVITNTFTDFNKKIERQSSEIKKLGTLLQKLHNGLNGKISHYGEENSRHFRYLCMKSEYDKMFYQHHNQMVTKSATLTPQTPRPKDQPHPRNPMNSAKCSMQSTRTLVPESSTKPLDENMREMVAQLKRFCLQYESSVILEEDLNKSGTSGSSGLRIENAYQTRTRMFHDDDTNMSSDGMTPRSVEQALNRMEAKHSKTSLATETLNSLNDDSMCGGDAKEMF